MSNRTRNWSQFNWRKVNTSPSRLAEFVDCPRFWVFSKVFKLMVPPIQAQPFGDIVHECCERYLEADANGRGTDGKPVEVFPDGWDRGESTIRYQDKEGKTQEIHTEFALTDVESNMARRLVEIAIEQGVLRRLPNSKIEMPFQITAPIVHEKALVFGFGDVVGEDTYEDHKTSKHQRYCLTPAKLKTNIQMMIGAAVVLMRAAREGRPLDQVVIRHNYFIKDPNSPKVFAREATVTEEEVEAFFSKVVLPIVDSMVELADKYGRNDLAKWEEIQGATKKNVCHKYGRDCPFLGICTKQYGPDRHNEIMQARIEAEAKNAKMATALSDRLLKPTAPKEDQVSIFDALEEKKNAKPAAPAKEAPPKEDVPQVTNSMSEPVVVTAAPWFDGCVACKDNIVPGFNSKMQPCKMCQAAGERGEGKKPSDYAVNFDDDRIIIQSLTDDSAYIINMPEVQAKETAPAKPSEKVDTTAVESQVQKATSPPAPEAAPEPPEETPKVKAPSGRKQSEKKEPAPKKPGRPREGMTILYGVAKRWGKGKKKIVCLTQVLHDLGVEMAADLGVDSFFLIDAYKRRDLLAAKAEEISLNIGTALVQVTNRTDPDLQALATALEPLADNVLEAVR